MVDESVLIKVGALRRWKDSRKELGWVPLVQRRFDLFETDPFAGQVNALNQVDGSNESTPGFPRASLVLGCLTSCVNTIIKLPFNCI